MFGGASAPATGGGLFGPSSAATPGTPSLFGGAAAPGGGLFGPSSAVAGGGALQPLGGGVLNGASGPLGVAQPAPSFLTTADGHPVKHFTQWNELAPAAQQNLEALEKKIVAAREESTLLEDVARLRGESRGRAEVPSGGEALRRELERRARVASDALRLVETQLWSDNERLAATRDAVTRTLRDVEHAQARLRRLGDARDADALAASHAQLRPGQPPPRDAAPVYVPPPRRPSPFLADATEDLYATAEAFERGTLEMEHNLRATGRVLGHGECGPGLEALAAALDGADKDALGYLSLANLGGGASVADAASGETRYGFTRRALRALGPNASDAEVRDAVEGARRYFDELRRDVAALRERTRRARAEHLAKLRREGDRRDPFAEAEREEEERNRLAALAERPEYAKVGGAAPGVAGTAGAPGAAAAGGALALPAPSPAAPGTAAPFGAPAATSPRRRPRRAGVCSAQPRRRRAEEGYSEAPPRRRRRPRRAGVYSAQPRRRRRRRGSSEARPRRVDAGARRRVIRRRVDAGARRRVIRRRVDASARGWRRFVRRRVGFRADARGVARAGDAFSFRRRGGSRRRVVRRRGVPGARRVRVARARARGGALRRADDAAAQEQVEAAVKYHIV